MRAIPTRKSWPGPALTASSATRRCTPQPNRTCCVASRHYVLGEVIDTMDVSIRAGLEPSSQQQHVARAIAERIEALWQLPGQGVWESRGEARHYTYSKVMASAGVDRCVRNKALHATTESDVLRRLAALRDRIHQEVC